MELVTYRLTQVETAVSELKDDVRSVDQSLCKLRLEQYQIDELQKSLADTNKAVVAIGGKLDALRKDLATYEVFPMAKRVQLVLKVVLVAIVTTGLGMILVGGHGG